ncbi:LptE family protein [uncultured Mucilaginibacter sp.]|uniref:LptE family protein n=1 Tax=uncultured Mucilaginibacter sp. TaxID=797541 RepID=UPI00260331D5|nr:LptE family protein [uncultured Mucilaginibacter sp.]
MKKYVLLLIVPLLFLFQSCGVYSLSGGSVGALKTVNVMYFENVAPLVINNLSQTFTQALQDRIRTQTRLSTVRGEADATLEGRITNYSIAPTVLPANTTNTAPIVNTNRLTITVTVKYTNSLDPKQSFEQSFPRYKDYQGDIGTQEQALIAAIVQQLTEDIFNRAFANW